MKTLIVSHIARGERSHTKKLLDAFLEATKDQDIEQLDLTKNQPDLFIDTNVVNYIKRNYLGEVLDAKKAGLSKMDMMTEQLKRADIVVLAFPMFNFSVPALVKAWFDAVMLKGETWDTNEKGMFGLLKGKKALILMASGGIYEGDFSGWEHAISLAKTEFSFMGFSDIRAVTVSGVNMMPDQVPEIEKKGQEEVRKIVKEWYG